MNARRDSLRAGLLVLFAAAAPWDAFLFLPGLRIRLTWLLALAILALEIADYARSHWLGVRFELLWPACALLLLALPPAKLVPMQGAMAILLGLAAARSAGPALARSVVAALAFSIGLLALYSVIFFLMRFTAPALAPLPSAYSLETGLLAPFGHTVVECVLLLFMGFAAAWSRFLRNDSATGFLRRSLLASAAPLLMALVILASLSLGAIRFWRPPDHVASTGTALAALVGGWLLARLLAKSLLEWRDMRHTISESTTLILAVLAFFAVLFPLEFRLLWGFLAGTAAGAVQSQRQLAPPPAKWAVAFIPVALLVAANIGGVHPADTHNPRHYETAARQDFAAADFARLESRMDYVETFWPNERRTHLWRAQLALTQDLLHEAAHEMALACRPAGAVRQLLPPPNDDEIDAVLVRLRDACSESASRTATLAHIQALLGAGKFKHAEALLAQELEESAAIPLPDGLDPDLDTAAYGCPCSWPLRAAVLKTIWPVDFEEPAELKTLLPEDLSGVQLLRLLLGWGAGLHSPPAAFPRQSLPLVSVAKCHRATIELACQAGGNLLTLAAPLTETPLRYDPAASYAACALLPGPVRGLAEWAGPEKSSAGTWDLMFEVQGETIAAAQLPHAITLASPAPLMPLPAPDTPIISIWL